MKKISLLLIVCMLLSFMTPACGNSEGSGEPKGGNNEMTTKADGTNADGIDSTDDDTIGGTDDADPEDAFDEDMAEITMAFYTSTEPNSASLEAVEAAINEISESSINVHVKLLPISMGSYDQQVNLMIAGNEALDLMATFFVGSTAFNSMQAQNQCLPLNDLMDEYGTDIKALFDEDALDTCSLNGDLMGVPIYKDNVTNIYFTMRTDILEQLGLKEKAENISTMSDIEAILTAVEENTDLTALASSGTSGPLHFSEALFVDHTETPAVFSRLANEYIGVLDTDPEIIVSLYETQAYKDSVQLVKDWYDKGLIYKDSTSSTDSNYTQIASGKFFGTFFIAQNATKIATIASCEYDMTTVRLCSLPLASSSYNTNTWVVPVTSREPEAAVKFLNLMYTNKEIVDLLNYGVEGTDYIVMEDGTYGYPEGMDSTSVGYHIEMTWLFGNQYLSGVWNGDDPNTRNISMELNKDALKSATFGFAPDISQFSTEIAAITSAINEYAGSLQNGLVDVDSTLEAFNAKLKAGGIDKVIASVQEQLDAWSKK